MLSSVPAEHTLLVSPEEGTYTGYFEICESEEVSEVYYQFTFVSFGGEKEARFVIDDNFGGKNMISIENNRLDGFTLGQSKEEIEKQKFDASLYRLEFEEQNGRQVLITVSVRDIANFKLNGNEINFHNLEEFLKEENPLVDDYILVFTKYRLTLIPDFKEKLFAEVLIYDESVKDLYEESYDDYYKTIARLIYA